MEEIVTGKQMKELDAYTIETMGVPSLGTYGAGGSCRSLRV